MKFATLSLPLAFTAASFFTPWLAANEKAREVAAEKAHGAPVGKASGVSADTALTDLKQGNARFTGNALTHPDQTAARRTEVAQGQHPFAVILTCADSRLSPEIIFDQGLGDLL